MTFTQHHMIIAALELIAARHKIKGDDWLEQLHTLFMLHKWQWPQGV